MTQAKRPVIELGCPGHFIGAEDCLWRRHTQVGTAFRVSTVGNYWLKDVRGQQPVGGEPDEKYETMVFPTHDAPDPHCEPDCGCRATANRGDPLVTRYAATLGDAQRQHEATVAEYVRRAEGANG